MIPLMLGLCVFRTVYKRWYHDYSDTTYSCVYNCKKSRAPPVGGRDCEFFVIYKQYNNE